ncbi:MAG: twin-arginine translocation signal domain-containing protein, partial [Actinomycetota bacterium]
MSNGEGSKGLDRRHFLKRFSAAGALSGATLLGGRELVKAQGAGQREHHAGSKHRLAGHGLGAVGRVDHAANGFH